MSSLSQNSTLSDLGLCTSRRSTGKGKRKREETFRQAICASEIMTAIDVDELFQQLSYARLCKAPYEKEKFESWLDINLWLKVTDELCTPINSPKPLIEVMLTKVRFYRKAYDDEPSLKWLKSNSLRPNLEIVFGPMNDRGSINFGDRGMLVLDEISSKAVCRDEGSGASNSSTKGCQGRRPMSISEEKSIVDESKKRKN